jgi:membrane-associated HD superfamily phosphohydrolase
LKKIISVILLIKSVILLYSSYFSLSNEEYFEVLNLQFSVRLYYIGMLVGVIFLVCSFGVYNYNRYLVLTTKCVIIIEVLYLTITTLYAFYSFAFLSFIGLGSLFSILLISIILVYLDFYILQQIKIMSSDIQ